LGKEISVCDFIFSSRIVFIIDVIFETSLFLVFIKNTIKKSDSNNIINKKFESEMESKIKSNNRKDRINCAIINSAKTLTNG
jgi:hypothetical protein